MRHAYDFNGWLEGLAASDYLVTEIDLKVYMLGS